MFLQGRSLKKPTAGLSRGFEQMMQLALSVVVMIAVVGGLSHWIIQKDRRQKVGDVVRDQED